MYYRENFKVKCESRFFLKNLLFGIFLVIVKFFFYWGYNVEKIDELW